MTGVNLVFSGDGISKTLGVTPLNPLEPTSVLRLLPIPLKPEPHRRSPVFGDYNAKIRHAAQTVMLIVETTMPAVAVPLPI